MDQGLSFNESEFKYLIVYSVNKQGHYFIFLKLQRLRNYLTLLLRSSYTIVTAIEIQMMNIIDRHFPNKSETIVVCTPK